MRNVKLLLRILLGLWIIIMLVIAVKAVMQ